MISMKNRVRKRLITTPTKLAGQEGVRGMSGGGKRGRARKKAERERAE